MVKNATIVILFALSWLNTYLVKNGHHPLPVLSEGQVAYVITFIVSVIAMVRDNPFKRKNASEAGK